MANPTHWLIRVRDGVNFEQNIFSRGRKFWSIKDSNNNGKAFYRDVRANDILWFVTNKEGGSRIIAVARYLSHNERVLGPLVALSPTNEDLGWNEPGYTKEFHFDDCYDVKEWNLTNPVDNRSTVIKYSNKFNYDLPLHWMWFQRLKNAKAL